MSNVSAGLVVCEKCGSLGRREEHLLMSNPPQQPYTCTNAACRHYWTERVGSAFADGYVVPTPMPNTTSGKIICPKCQSNAQRIGNTLASPPSPIYGCAACGHEWREVDTVLPKTPAEKALERDEERREEKHALHVQFMHKQLATMDAEAAYRTVIQAHHIRQTEALEGILALLRKVQEDHARERDEGPHRSRVVMD